MANCTTCGHAASLHTYGKAGKLGSGCKQCVGAPHTGSKRCTGLALASANCATCGHPIVDHSGHGQACHKCVGAPYTGTTRCPGGSW